MLPHLLVLNILMSIQTWPCPLLSLKVESARRTKCPESCPTKKLAFDLLEHVEGVLPLTVVLRSEKKSWAAPVFARAHVRKFVCADPGRPLYPSSLAARDALTSVFQGMRFSSLPSWRCSFHPCPHGWAEQDRHIRLDEPGSPPSVNRHLD